MRKKKSMAIQIDLCLRIMGGSVNAEVDEYHDRFAPSPLKENNRTVRVER